MSDIVLDVRDLQVQFFTENKRVDAVSGIDFQLRRGQTLGIVGESGSGKSVTSLAIMGLIPTPGKITGGEIWFKPKPEAEAVNLLRLSEEQKRRFRGGEVAMIFQEPMSALNPVYNIGFQLIEAIRQHEAISQSEARRQAIARLQEVKLLPSDRQLRDNYLQQHPNLPDDDNREISQHINEQKLAMLKRYPHELSGGQLQRVCIAMAISCNPTLLIADEPTTALDVTVQATILDLLRDLCMSRGMSLIFITHDLGVIAEIADRVAVMYQGKIVEKGNIRQIFLEPQHPYTKGLLACRPRLDREAEFLPTVADFMSVETDAITGELVIKEKLPEENLSGNLASQENLEILPEIKPKTPILSVQNLQVGFPQRGMFGQTKRYFMAVNNVSFDVYSGETLGLVGESGCGKSTLARTLLRLIPTMQGEISFEGQNITDLQGKLLRRLRREMQIVFQNPYNSLNPRLTIGKTIMEPLEIHQTIKSARQRKERAVYLLERVGLSADSLNRYPHSFSGGQRQRVCIARALALNPKFIICDESVSALDVSVQAQVLNLLKELQSEFGLTYIFISHDLSVVKFMSDRIMVMNKGKIEEIGLAERIYSAPETEYTRQLIASIPTGELKEVETRSRLVN
ncbi:ABC transporter ATP-binding protein [Oscillatoria salina]|uniref:ABC transporter ATP-binding protein n=1 Tax=Oscillatoria salina TaxID=331517 RepID=UPI0013B67663|nr:ABC transporter ATP-binding protein [Oscillatoria salina]MBZ8183184.1 ABC transporter ATP-binding protein [Oscillatoria salina IIICB1]NET86950.1 ABC transporter ATP-binding protein [Kamptonema sp. SIO1D9]